MESRYYHREHFDAYRRIRRDRLDQWNDLHQARTSFDDFPSRSLLARALTLPTAGLRVLEYGCGTGAAACFLAEQGCRVEAVDLVPDAIALAREHAEKRQLTIEFAVADVCSWGEASDQYDVVVDSLCLQSIVTDADRARLFAAVRERLKPSGRYLISTAMFDPAREYDDDHYDPATGIVWTPTEDFGPDSTVIAGARYAPHRRHLRPLALQRELQDHGFDVVEQSGPFGGEIIARRQISE
jgi:2-polyprenyl-3-methyl-5-hydroxy-6-metoxy-1,4-benzoquinol methylase